MQFQSPSANDVPSQSVGAVLLWCVLAGVLVTALLCVDAPGSLGGKFWNPPGVMRLLADLLIFYCMFIVPLFRLPSTSVLKAMVVRNGVVLFSGVAGLAMLSFLTDAGCVSLLRVAGFVVLVVAASTVWVTAMAERIAFYYGVAAFTAFGVPIARFFFEELFRNRAVWPSYVSPFTAWRVLVEGAEFAYIPWIVFGCVLTGGFAAMLVHRRRVAR